MCNKGGELNRRGENVKIPLTLRIDYFLSSAMGGEDVQFWYAIF